MNFIGQSNTISINPQSKVITINGKTFGTNSGTLTAEKGRVVVGRYTIKYLFDKLTLYLDKIAIDTCLREDPGLDTAQDNLPEIPRTFYITASKTLVFSETSKTIFIDNQLIQAVQVNDVGIHKVFRSKAGDLSISTNKVFPSMWNGLELLESK